MRPALPSILGETLCFVPDGTDRHAAPNAYNQTYEPCEQDGDHSMCCNVSAMDECRGGLCWNEAEKRMWRESCSDPTWQSPKCLKLCISDDELDPDGNPMSSTDVRVTQCSDESYCCGFDRKARDCCQAGRGVRIVNGQVVDPSSTSSSSPSSASRTASLKTASVASATVWSGSGESSNPAGIIGGAVGGGITVVTILILGGWFFWHRKTRTAGNATVTSAVEQDRLENFQSNQGWLN